MESGIAPVSRLWLKSILSRARQAPIVEGIESARRFWLMSRMLKTGKVKLGIEPVRVLPLKSNDRRPVIRLSEIGIEPLRLFLWRSRTFKRVRLPSSIGMGPTCPFSLSTSVWSVGPNCPRNDGIG